MYNSLPNDIKKHIECFLRPHEYKYVCKQWYTRASRIEKEAIHKISNWYIKRMIRTAIPATTIKWLRWFESPFIISKRVIPEYITKLYMLNPLYLRSLPVPKKRTLHDIAKWLRERDIDPRSLVAMLGFSMR